jgi:hypothetical protein
MDDKIGLVECLYSGVEDGTDVLEHVSISSNEQALTSTSNTENTEKDMLEIPRIAIPQT